MASKPRIQFRVVDEIEISTPVGATHRDCHPRRDNSASDTLNRWLRE